MENFTPISALIGGAMIGLSAVWLMAANGRIAGISGIFGGLFSPGDGKSWRLAFLTGLIVMPWVLVWLYPALGRVHFQIDAKELILAGALVGLGTQLSNGCTSGHGVCGIARLSMRSLLATLTFMTTGIITVFLCRYLGVY